MTLNVRNLMMGFMLAGSLLMSSPVSAQGRRHGGGNDATMSSRGSSARESRSSEFRSHDNRSAQSMNTGRQRPETREMTSRRETTAPKNDRPSGGNERNNDRRPGGGSNFNNDRGNNDRPGGGNNYNNDRGNNRPGGGSNFNNDRGNNDRPGGGNNYNNNDRGNNRPGGGNNYNNDRGNNDRRHGGGNNHYNDRGNDRRPGSGNNHYNDRRPGGYDHNRRPEHHGDRGYHAYRDHYSWNHAHNNWSRPLPPPARSWRPAPYRHHRPIIPHGYRPYYGAPVIDRILGITFGTMFDVSLNYLYTNGYYIDGYENGVVYLRNVNMMNLEWDDVMLCYDDYNRLINGQFIYSSYYNDRSRYNRLYNELCASYGSPIDFDGRGYTWFGGNSVGYVTLSISSSGSRFYTNLYIGS